MAGITISLFVYAVVTKAFTNPSATPPNNGVLIPVNMGGTGASSTAQALANLGAAASGANSDITSLTPLTGNPLQIGNSGLMVGSSFFDTDQGGAMELGGTNSVANPVAGGVPYIDFHYGTGTAQDYNVRIINNANNSLGIYASGSLTLNVGSASTDSMIIGGGLGTLKVGTLTFSDGTSQTTAATGIPSGIDILSTSQTAPSGYTYTGNSVFYGTSYPIEWVAKAAIPECVYQQTATVVNGIIYVIGGWRSTSCNNSAGGTSLTYAYNPSTNSWTNMASAPAVIAGAAADAVNGIIYEIGGGNGSYSSTNYAYNPSTNSWTSEASMPISVEGAAAVAVNGLVYVMGGYNGSYLSSVYAYNPSTNSWTSEASMPNTLAYASAVNIGGIIYVFGGTNGSYQSSVYAYNPSTNSWSSKASMPIVNAVFGIAYVNGFVYMVGANSGTSNLVYMYNPTTNTWIGTTTSFPNDIWEESVAAVNGVIYAMGGFYGSVQSTNYSYTTPSIYYLMSKN